MVGRETTTVYIIHRNSIHPNLYDRYRCEIHGVVYSLSMCQSVTGVDVTQRSSDNLTHSAILIWRGVLSHHPNLEYRGEVSLLVPGIAVYRCMGPTVTSRPTAVRFRNNYNISDSHKLMEWLGWALMGTSSFADGTEGLVCELTLCPWVTICPTLALPNIIWKNSDRIHYQIFVS